MSMPAMTHPKARGRALHLLLPVVMLAACSVSDADQRSHEGQAQVDEGDVSRGGWSPATVNDVKGVPIASLRTAVQQRLAAQRPSTVEEEAWQHTKRLYARFQQSPLWFDHDGLDKERAQALTNALLHAPDDGL